MERDGKRRESVETEKGEDGEKEYRRKMGRCEEESGGGSVMQGK